MKPFGHLWTWAFWEAEGAGAASSGGSGAATGAGAGSPSPGKDGAGAASGGESGASDLPDLVKNAAAANGSPGGQDGAGSAGNDPGGAATPYWPEGLPETLGALKGANDRETIEKLTGRLKDLPAAPEKPDGYKVELSEEFTKRFGDLGNDPVLSIWRDIAHKNGLDNRQFNGAISELYQQMSDKGMLDTIIDPKAEFEKLMPKHGDPVSRATAANARITGVANKIGGLVSREVLSKAQGNIFLSLAATADGIGTLEAIFGAMGEHGLQGGGDGGGKDSGRTQHEKQMRAMFPSMSKV